MTALGTEGTRDDHLERVARLFDRQHERIYRLARRLTRDPEEARDLLQETFLRAASRPRSLPIEEPAAEAWLVRTTVNLCRDRGRRLAVRKRDHHKVQIEQPQKSADDPEAQAIARTSVEAALATLTPRRRAVIALVELEELSTRRAGELLGMATATVRWHLARGRRELRRALAPLPEETSNRAGSERETP